ncbi:MAG: DUF3857 domain-containing protein [Cytophagales bacterium]|nr:DUF3857 domain-containing protein [Cytophagales bacterium]
MNFIRNIVLSVLVLLQLSLIAQTPVANYENYQWEKNPKLHKLSEEDSKKFELILKEKRSIEFIDQDEYEFRHKIVRVNSNRAIENNNRIYLPLRQGDLLKFARARVITPSGKVLELDSDDIQTAQDPESKRVYKYFALKGIELGSEIEQITYTRSYSNLAGSIVFLQDDTEKRDVDFELITPKHIGLKVKPVNAPSMTMDSTSIPEKIVWKVHLDKVEKAEKEDFAVLLPNLVQIHYKQDKYSFNSGESRMFFTWHEIVESVYLRVHWSKNLPKKERKAQKKDRKRIKKFLKEAPLKTAKSEKEKIAIVEQFIKERIQVVDAYNTELSNIEFILTNKAANSVGISKLYMGIFEQLKIKANIVLTSNRDEIKFDKDFEGFHQLQSYLIHFPNSDLYISPTDNFSRMQLIPHNCTDNGAVFIYAGNNDDAPSYEFKYIEALPAEATVDALNLKIEFDENDISTLNIDMKRELTGYYAKIYQPYFDFLGEKQLKEIKKSMVQYIGDDIEIANSSFENTGLNNLTVNPLTVKATLSSTSHVEKAKDKYLFRIGDLIGAQAEMYQDKERKFPVENDFNRTYNRVLSFKIPEGYKVNNLEDLKFNVSLAVEGKTSAIFDSKYVVNGDEVTVTITEYYKSITYPKELFEQYRKVINAAADFNKVILFLEKK